MSVFGPNQREEVMFCNAVAAETTLATFIASASDKELKILSADGTAPAAGEDFKVYQKTASGYEFSDIVKADKVEKVILATYSAEVQKSVTVSVDAATAGQTYVVECRMLEDSGALSPENFNFINGYYVSQTGDTVTTIRDGLLASLNYAIKKREDNVITATANSTDEIIVAGVAQVVKPGKDIGRLIEFDVNVKAIDNDAVNGTNVPGQISAAVTAQNDPGVGTGKYAVNLEWFCKGYGGDVYREVGYPIDFTETYYANPTGVYNVIHIKYFDDRISPSVEKQPKVLTIMVDKGTDTLANNASTNAVLDDLQLILGAANVPGDLPIA